jgi:small subunit ribosomal protein S15
MTTKNIKEPEKEMSHSPIQLEKGDSKDKKPSWIKIKPAELEKLIIGLAKEGHDLAKIGLILRDKHGIPKTKLFGKKISHILKEREVEYIDETKIIEERTNKLKSHIAKNKHDHPASRSLTKKLWVLHSRKA